MAAAPAQLFPPRTPGPARLVVLVSGSGTNLQALLDAAADPAYGAEILAVGADRDGIAGLERAEKAGLPVFVHRVKDFADRADWDRALTAAVAAHEPDLVVTAGFMKILGPSSSRPSPGGSSTPTPHCCPPSPAPTASPTRSRTG